MEITRIDRREIEGKSVDVYGTAEAPLLLVADVKDWFGTVSMQVWDCVDNEHRVEAMMGGEEYGCLTKAGFRQAAVWFLAMPGADANIRRFVRKVIRFLNETHRPNQKQ